MSDEASDSFECFGSICTVHVTGAGPLGRAEEAAAGVRRRLLEWHTRFSRFLPDSELSRLNGDPQGLVRVSPLMARFAACVRGAASLTDGLVDATLLDAVQDAGYAGEIAAPLPLARALALAPERRPAAAGAARWRELEVDVASATVVRPPGLKLDSGGIAKGLFADVLAAELAGHARFAVNCAGDLFVGGAEAVSRSVEVESPFDAGVMHTFEIEAGGVATSGIGRRSWLDERGEPAHHLLDPATGRPAFTGIVQASALADSALGAEIRAKAALLSGPRGAARWLAQGGVVVFDDGSHQVFEPPRTIELSELSGYVQARQTAAAEHV
ncbi:MAG TPA: FAD:protein FMN transferase [Solirubrobacteraceae bacterium]|nr:FAD:protein FMN transferase [Solirubrobacteraceae bacterium]